MCERKICMFRHEESKKEDENDNDDSVNESEVDVSDTDQENVKELIPILEWFKEAVAKFDVLLQKCSLKCKECEFEAKDTNGLVMHMKAKHRLISLQCKVIDMHW